MRYRGMSLSVMLIRTLIVSSESNRQLLRHRYCRRRKLGRSYQGEEDEVSC